MSEDFIKEAEQTVLNRVKDLDVTIRLIDAIVYRYANQTMPERWRTKFADAMGECRSIVYSVYGEALRDLFVFTGVGGEQAKEYAIEAFVRRFGDEDVRYDIMGLLSSTGETPTYRSADEAEFRRQAKELI